MDELTGSLLRSEIGGHQFEVLRRPTNDLRDDGEGSLGSTMGFPARERGAAVATGGVKRYCVGKMRFDSAGYPAAEVLRAQAAHHANSFGSLATADAVIVTNTGPSRASPVILPSQASCSALVRLCHLAMS